LYNIIIIISCTEVHFCQFSTNSRYVPPSSQWNKYSSNFRTKNAEIRRRLNEHGGETGFLSDWEDPDNYHHKVAEIIKYETSAEVHLPGSPEYTRRRVRNGTCKAIFPDMIIVPKFENDISRVLQISNIIGVPISVKSEGRSYNLCKTVNPGKHFAFFHLINNIIFHLNTLQISFF
jgi:hypothetical protein